MDKTVSDLKQRQRALDPSESFIVQAPAGSGKTELLIQRYLRLLSLVDEPEEIVAITFTRKAAAEMQGRIMQALELARTQQAPDDDYARTTYELACKALAQDQKHCWQLASNPARLRIQTIDALCAWLTRQMPILSSFGAQPETINNADELYRLAAANTLTELESKQHWSAIITDLLNHLDNDLPRARDMLASMLSRRDQWLRHVMTDVRRAELEGALKHLVESTLSTLRQSFPADYNEELLTLLRYAASHLQEQETSSIIRHCLDIDQLPGHCVEDLPQWQAIATFFFTGKGDWRKQANKSIGFPAPADNKAEQAIRKAMKDRFAALLANMSENKTIHSLLSEMQGLPPVSYTENEWQVVNVLCKLLILADAKLRLLFAERNQIDFSGITLAAIQALGSAEAPSDLALHLDYQTRHFLLDEFQDISINQYLLLQRLTAGWSTGDGHSLFLVGDPMQSIYRFREAEVGLFLNTWQAQRLGQMAVTPLSITVNFRSQAGIVHWLNETFKQVFPPTHDISRGAVSYARAEAFHEQLTENAVVIHPALSRDDELEAEQVLQIVNKTRQRDTNASIAILVRSRGHLSRIVPCLKKAGLSFRAVEIEALGQRPAIQDLLALTFALSHLADRVSWLAILRAPWCGLTLHDLFTLTGQAQDKLIWQCMQDDVCVQTLTNDGQQRLTRLRTILQQAFADQRRRRLSRWVESTWMHLGGPATVEEQTDLENAYTFFRLLDEYDEGSELKDRQGFMQQVGMLYAAPDVGADENLQIMTIHKSKGLEFDCVILPGLSRGSGSDEARLLLWSESPHGAHPDLLLAPIKQAGDEKSPIYDYVQRLQRKKQMYEQGRLLYVAATRAKKQLHLLGAVEVKTNNTDKKLSVPRGNSLLAQLWPAVKSSYEQALNRLADEKNNEAIQADMDNTQIRRLTSTWQLPSAPKQVAWMTDHVIEQTEISELDIEYHWAGETIKHIGTVVHRCIQLIAAQGLDVWDEDYIKNKRAFYRLSLKRLGVTEEDSSWAGSRVEEALIKMTGDERGQWLLSKEHTEQHNEYAISGDYQGKVVNVIIDRTFVDKQGVRWIVDYKSSRHEGADLQVFLEHEQQRYNEQLRKYATLLSGMETRPIKLGLYFPLLKGWREWEYIK